MLTYLAYPRERTLHNTIKYVHFLSQPDSGDFHRMESARVFLSCDLPTAPLRSTGRSRSMYWASLLYAMLFCFQVPRTAANWLGFPSEVVCSPSSKMEASTEQFSPHDEVQAPARERWPSPFFSVTHLLLACSSLPACYALKSPHCMFSVWFSGRLLEEPSRRCQAACSPCGCRSGGFHQRRWRVHAAWGDGLLSLPGELVKRQNAGSRVQVW